jgi:hypothetical protein
MHNWKVSYRLDLYTSLSPSLSLLQDSVRYDSCTITAPTAADAIEMARVRLADLTSFEQRKITELSGARWRLTCVEWLPPETEFVIETKE